MTAMKKLVGLTALSMLFVGGALAQTTSLEGDVKGDDGKDRTLYLWTIKK